jgi:SAM-dependent methyltransferase
LSSKPAERPGTIGLELMDVTSSLLDDLDPRPGERILDLGCGEGLDAARIAEAGAEVVGFDLAADRIDRARRAWPQIRFEVADASDFAFDGAFDAVYSNAVIHWVKPTERLLACVRKALKPGGRFLFETGARAGLGSIIEAVQASAQALGAAPWEFPWHDPNPTAYATLMQAEGLEMIYAAQFRRKATLGGQAKLHAWIESLAGPTRPIPSDRDEFFRRIEERLRPILQPGGAWIAGHRRHLRMIARRPLD